MGETQLKRFDQNPRAQVDAIAWIEVETGLQAAQLDTQEPGGDADRGNGQVAELDAGPLQVRLQSRHGLADQARRQQGCGPPGGGPETDQE